MSEIVSVLQVSSVVPVVFVIATSGRGLTAIVVSAELLKGSSSLQDVVVRLAV